MNLNRIAGIVAVFLAGLATELCAPATGADTSVVTLDHVRGRDLTIVLTDFVGEYNDRPSVKTDETGRMPKT
jgi:hypothetical protein